MRKSSAYFVTFLFEPTQIQNSHMSGHGLLKGKKGIIFGALNEQSLAWKIAANSPDAGLYGLLRSTL